MSDLSIKPPHAYDLLRKPVENERVRLDNDQEVIVVNSNGRSRWMHVRPVAGGDVFLATFSLQETHEYEPGERHPMHTDRLCTCGEPFRSAVHRWRR